MAITKVSKLKLKDGQFLKLTLLSPDNAYYSDIFDHAERYIDKLGDDMTPYEGLAQRWNLDNDHHIELHVEKGVDSEGRTIYNISNLGFYAPDGGRMWAWSGGNNFSEYLSIGLLVDDENQTAAITIIKDIYWDDDLGQYSAQGIYFNRAIYNAIYGSTSDITDPFDPGGESEDNQGGDGEFIQPSDPIDFPDIPDISVVDTGFISLYSPSLSELQGLASYLWSHWDDWGTNFSKLFTQPMDAILGLSIVPFQVPKGPIVQVKFGNITAPVSMTKALRQYVDIDCGTVTIPAKWKAYLDYSPYTRVQLFLPMIGTHAIDADEIIGKAVHIKYHIDILSGSCTAYVKCASSVLYEFSGQCATQIPVNGNDFSSLLSSAVATAAVVGTLVATGGSAAPVAAGAEAAGTGLSAGAVIGAGAAAANNVMNAKPHVERSGSLSGSAGILGHRKPYFFITRPRQCLPANQNKFEGYPSYVTKKLSECSGFTVVSSIHLENIPATNAEKEEILMELMKGVII